MIPTIATTLRELVRLAAIGGADPAWLKTAGDELVALLLELEQLRRAADPRKVATLDLARRVAQANAALISAGVTDGRSAVLRRRFGLSRSRVAALLAMSCETRDGCVIDSLYDVPESVRSERPARRYGRE